MTDMCDPGTRRVTKRGGTCTRRVTEIGGTGTRRLGIGFKFVICYQLHVSVVIFVTTRCHCLSIDVCMLYIV